LINARGNGGRSKSFTFPYFVFEDAVLGELKELDPASVMPRKSDSQSTADVLRVKLANHREDIANLKRDLATKYSKTLVELLRTAEDAEEKTANELQDELARTAKPLERNWKELPTLIDFIKTAPDPDAARLKLRPALRAIIESASVLIVPSGAWRCVAVQFVFTGGAIRSYLICHRTAGNQRSALTSVASFADAHLPSDANLRTPAAAAKLEKLLVKHMAKLGTDKAKK
jgi:hypothetical protein